MNRYHSIILSCLLATSALQAQTDIVPSSSYRTELYAQGNPESKTQPNTIKPETMPPAKPSDALFNPCSDCAAPCRTGPWQQIWFRGGYSLWRIGDGPLAYPLLTNGTQPLGDPTTAVLYGNEKVDFDAFQGFTLSGGIWLDQDHVNGLGLGLQMFSTQTSSAFFSSNGNDGLNLSRPFFDSTQNLPFQNSIVQVSIDGVRSGSFSVTNTAQIGGFDVHYLRNLAHNERFTLNGLVGYRFFQLKEQLDLVQKSTTIDDGSQPLLLDNLIVNSLTLQDSFHTRNQINGVEVGLQGEMQWGILFAGGVTKVTLGSNRQTIDINGSSTGTTDTGVATLPGGMLALSTNSGQSRDNQFVIMPELSAYFGVQVTSHIRLQLGYDWLYINNVVRPGSQIDPAINQRYLPSSQFFNDLAGPVTPRRTEAKNDFVASGVSLSLEIQY